MEKISFTLNGRPVSVSGLSPETTLLRWLRDTAAMPGTKEGCAEGDCGACTVAILEPDAPDGPAWRAVNACLVLLPSVHGAAVVTVEGLADGERLHPAQEAMVRHLGSQCGYCTPGVVMSAFEATYRKDIDASWKIDDQMCGNLCRCTGYRPIRDALTEVAGSCPEDGFSRALEAGPGASLDYEGEGRRYIRPLTLPALWAAMEAHPGARIVAGTTDLGLEVTRRHGTWPVLLAVDGIAALREIRRIPVGISVGAAIRLSHLETEAATALPVLARMLRYFGARQIKNRATLGGNLCNASPIGDLAPVLLALDATFVAASAEGERRIPAEDFFVAYRRTALAPGEILAAVEIPDPAPEARLGAYKVSRRRELDISAVAAAMCVLVDQGGTVRHVRIAYGGMASTPARARRAEAALLGEAWGEPALEAAIEVLGAEFQPIDDARATAWYRRTVAANLLRGFFEESRAGSLTTLPERHVATVLPEVQP